MIPRIKEWLSEFRPHLVTDGELWAVRKRFFFGGFSYYSNRFVTPFWWKPREDAWTDRKTAERWFKEVTRKYRIKKVDPKNPVRLVEGGEK